MGNSTVSSDVAGYLLEAVSWNIFSITVKAAKEGEMNSFDVWHHIQ
jgi:hypothetical protein